jgi:BirA family biotin operon repressor/biotin-[acetyl-CoA-carboxylase] ligase
MAVGIGLNCLQHRAHFPPELRDRATSLELESRMAIDRGAAVARSVIRRMDAHFGHTSRPTDAELAAAWRSHSADLGARVCLSESGQTFPGHIIDIDPHAGLLLQLDTGARRHFHPAVASRV